MERITDTSFGPLIAYLIPGATVVAALSPYSQPLQAWLAATPDSSPTIGGFLYLTLAAFAAGMAVSAIRWAVIDRFHARMGIVLPPLDFSRLVPSVDGFMLLIDSHYRHFLHYGNMVIACLIAYVSYRVRLGATFRLGWLDALFPILEILFFAASRDTLKKYYRRSEQLLSASRRKP